MTEDGIGTALYWLCHRSFCFSEATAHGASRDSSARDDVQQLERGVARSSAPGELTLEPLVADARVRSLQL